MGASLTESNGGGGGEGVGLTFKPQAVCDILAELWDGIAAC